MVSQQGDFYIPDDDVLREVGRVVIRHGHLDHMMRLVIKRLLSISINDRGYATETKGMSKDLRGKLLKLSAAKFKGEPEKRELFASLLDKAEDLTKVRNCAVHAVWMRVPGRAPALYDKDKIYAIPTIEMLSSIEKQIDTVKNIINALSRSEFKVD